MSNLAAPPRDVVVRFYPEIREFVAKATDAWAAAGGVLTLSSWYRDPVHNRAEGGLAFSQHTAALSADFVGTREARHAMWHSARAAGLVAIENASHLHIQLRPAGFLLRRAAIRSPTSIRS